MALAAGRGLGTEGKGPPAPPPGARAAPGGGAPLVGVAVEEVVDHHALGEAAPAGAGEALVAAGGRDRVAPVDRVMEAHPGRGVERAEARPAELDAGEAAEDEARRRHRRPVRRAAGVGFLAPEGVYVADSGGGIGHGPPGALLPVDPVVAGRGPAPP